MEIPHWLEKRAFLSPNQTAIQLTDGTTISFANLRQDAVTFAGKLIGCGVKCGDRIALLSSNSYQMVVAIHAMTYINCSVVLLNTRLSGTEWQFQYDDAACTYLLYEDIYEADIKNLTVSSRDTYSLTAIEKQKETSFNIPTEMDLEQIFTILYTSGTTGFPKGVQLTYGNHFWSAVSSALNLGLHKQDRWLATLPLFHVGGLSILIRSTVYGIPVHLHTKYSKQAIHRDIMDQGITIVSVVTVMLEELLGELGEQNYPSSMRCMLLGGGPVPRPLLEKCKKKGVPVFQTYGMTETSSQIVTLSHEDALHKLGSAGKALFTAQVKIVKEGKKLEPNDIGEIMVKGPMVTRGYYKREEANKEAFQNGWLHTGDLGYLDEDGYLYVVDRRKDLIVSGGENVYPAEIESVLKELDSVKDAGVVGITDKKWGQVPVAFIVQAGSKHSQDINQLKTFCKDRLAKYKIPKKFFFVDELPRNASKKLLRRELLEWVKREED
ncbi:O-succinylbenzoic acid--CoA ligase [Salirhabdus euzebyi]|uniref:2-succinylbenzoate--CoA ligase n=1 Tax=Salirhabdus euzebyi TaxID=394506 RepID=A0A841Q4R5_9BACI|nr:o-succinylbenzoate--CoA ligase [Salirhabdus euzebyi]MBB6453401.1 O-succinylbenzoic acid--CoA ligase [Salirhabdus euzebyi]